MLIRPVTPEDKALLTRLFSELSLETRYRRFFMAVRERDRGGPAAPQDGWGDNYRTWPTFPRIGFRKGGRRNGGAASITNATNRTRAARFGAKRVALGAVCDEAGRARRICYELHAAGRRGPPSLDAIGGRSGRRARRGARHGCCRGMGPFLERST
jgi:hypothetical protein